MLSLHYINQKLFDKSAVLFCFIQIFQFVVAVNLCVSARICRCNSSEVVPVLRNFSIFIKTENIKCDLLA